MDRLAAYVRLDGIQPSHEWKMSHGLAFWLLDQDAAGQCGRQLLIQALRIMLAGPADGNTAADQDLEIRERGERLHPLAWLSRRM